jgi:hypothetical protein
MWKKINDYPQYLINENGNVKRISAAKGAVIGRVLKPGTDSKGYLTICLCKNSKSKKYRLHRLH